MKVKDIELYNNTIVCNGKILAIVNSGKVATGINGISVEEVLNLEVVDIFRQKGIREDYTRITVKEPVLKQYYGFQDRESMDNYVPFSKLEIGKDEKKEVVSYITDGANITELTLSKREQLQKVMVQEKEFINLTKNLEVKTKEECKDGDLFEKFGYLFTLEGYQTSSDFMKKHNLVYKDRQKHHNPLYKEKFGPISVVKTR